MKDSGLEWIGQIPDEWLISKIGHLYHERNVKVSDLEYPPLSVTMRGIVPQLATAAKSDAHDQRKLVCKGDFAINSRSDRRGSCGISEYAGSVSLINIILTPNEDIHPRYYDWLFHTVQFADEFYKWGHGIVDDLWTTNWRDMKNISITVPPLLEQKIIADFLDKECAEIDSLAEKTRESIEEYKKLKQAVITEAVTKGVRGKREMKDSGVEWIGEMPKEWTLSRVGLHHNIILGKMLCSEQPNNDYSLESYLCAVNVHFDGVSTTDLKEMWFSEIEKSQYHVENGDLLVVEGGAGAGGCAIVHNLQKPTFIQNSIMIVRNKRNSNIRYLRYLVECLVKRGYIDVVCNKATIPHFTKNKLSTMPFLVLPKEEQQEIADYLDKKTAEIDTLIAKKEALLEELDAYKKSLIYEYVTGKKRL